MNKQEFVHHIIGKTSLKQQESSQFSPTNIALIKYWGKRNSELNLPITSSLSLTLPLGTHTRLIVSDTDDKVFLNDQQLSQDSTFYKRLFAYIDLFRTPGTYFHVHTKNDIPTAAGLASSASGFSALILALNELYDWNLTKKELSMLARLGSGSSSRSLFNGFVQWHKGSQDSGLDSFAEALDATWPDLRMGLWVLQAASKPICSRNAMQKTIETSHLFRAWPDQVAHDLERIKEAIVSKDFSLLGKISEHNALSMHATMLASQPAVCYFLPETISAMQKVWQLRKSGLEVYFTMDAGPNLKLLYLEKDEKELQNHIPEISSLSPFDK